jgi:catechol 2,3-dioxygenase-like lactoylglutathione lyase family enzyme
MTTSDAVTRGIHHLGLTVAELEPPQEFLEQVLGFRTVGSNPAYPAVFLSDGTVTLTLWKVQADADPVPFDRKRNVGLHHLALALVDPHGLDALSQKVRAWPGVQIEFGPEPTRAGSQSRHVMFTIPGGLRLELRADPTP